MKSIIRWACVIAAGLAPALLSSTAIGADPVQVTIVGAGKGAGAFRQAGAVAETVNKYSKTVRVTNQESPGFVGNTRMIARGRVEFALTNGVLVDAILRREHPFTKEKSVPKNLRGIGPVAGAWLQIAVLADSDMKQMADLKGKRVSMGPKGSNSAYMLETTFKKLGIFDSMRKDYLKWDDAANYMIDGKLDAFGIPNPIPSPSILQAAQSRPVRVLDLPENVRDEFLKISKGYSKTDADMSVYNGMKGKKIKTVSYSVYMLTQDTIPAEVVYEVAKAFYDPKHRDFVLSVYKPLRDGLDAASTPAFIGAMKSFGLELHPGAARYWKERGYAVN